MRLVAFDTAGPVIGVAATDGSRRIVRTERVTRGAEARLVPWAIALCAELGFELDAVDAVAVAVGPGAFTGLRVGLATACGLAQALGVPVWPGDSLATRAARARSAAPVLAALDARKGRVYAALYAADGAVVRPPADVDPDVAFGWAAPGTVATGEGSLVYEDLARAAGLTLADAADDPAVDALLALAADGLAAGGGVAATDVRPVYLRAPDARPPAALSR